MIHCTVSYWISTLLVVHSHVAGDVDLKDGLEKVYTLLETEQTEVVVET